MQQWPGHWPRAAREIAESTASAVAAAAEADPDAFGESTAQLLAADPERVRAVHSTMVRELLEDAHPDGLSGEAVQSVLDRCARAAASWLPDLDAGVLAVVLTGSLGVSDPDEDAVRVGWAPIVRHAVLVIADLVTVTRVGVDGYLHRAIAEIARAETVELP